VYTADLGVLTIPFLELAFNLLQFNVLKVQLSLYQPNYANVLQIDHFPMEQIAYSVRYLATGISIIIFVLVVLQVSIII
jgi:hypothetical protein